MAEILPVRCTRCGGLYILTTDEYGKFIRCNSCGRERTGSPITRTELPDGYHYNVAKNWTELT